MPDAARLIDFHTNCSCGRDVAAALAVVDDADLGPMLTLQVQTTGGRVEQRVPIAKATTSDAGAAAEAPAGDLEPVAVAGSGGGKPAAGASKPARAGRGRVQSL